MESHTTVIIPLDDCVIFVSLLNCAECSSRLSEVAQTLDAISGIQHLVGGSRTPRAVASWHGLSQGPLRRVPGAVGELYAIWVSACWRYGSYLRVFFPRGKHRPSLRGLIASINTA